MIRPPNLDIHCSRSGKMTKEHATKFFELIKTHFGERTLLLLDSWPSFNNPSLMPSVPEEKVVKKLIIPPKLTGHLQPLDVYFFGPWKKFQRKVENYVILHKIQFPLQHRNNVLKILSAIFHQFCAPRYKPMIEYAWYEAGYSSVCPEKVPAPKKYCFGITVATTCHCGARALIRCSYENCSPLCFKHFVEDMHFCNQ